MIKNLVSFTGILVSVLLLIVTGCEKAPIRDDVEGFWILERYTVLSDNKTVECSRLYYSITNLVTEVSDKGDNGFDSYIARSGYEDDNNVLVLRDFKVRGGTTADNGQNAPLGGLRNYGINSQEETRFRIVSCKGGRMTLESDYARLELKKF